MDSSRTSPDAQVRVLVVDDHDRARRGLRDLLASVAGVEVVGEATNGAEAIALAADLRPDVVLMDVSMPTIDGLEATRQIVAQNPTVRVIVMTAYHGLEHAAKSAGAVAHLLKGASRHELLRCLKHASD